MLEHEQRKEVFYFFFFFFFCLRLCWPVVLHAGSHFGWRWQKKNKKKQKRNFPYCSSVSEIMLVYLIFDYYFLLLFQVKLTISAAMTVCVATHFVLLVHLKLNYSWKKKNQSLNTVKHSDISSSSTFSIKRFYPLAATSTVHLPTSGDSGASSISWWIDLQTLDQLFFFLKPEKIPLDTFTSTDRF